jgi:SAM-dependent methyltransferase
MHRRPTYDSAPSPLPPFRATRDEAIGEHLRARLALDRDVTEVLDFGCGSGDLAFLLAPWVRRVTAIDSSPALIAELQKKIRRAGMTSAPITNLRASCLDLNAAPRQLLGAEFDLIVSVMTLHHFDEPRRILTGLKSLLKSDGFLCIIDLAPEDGSFHGGSFHGAATPPPHYGFDPDDFAATLAELGFFHPTLCEPYVIKTTRDGAAREYTLFMAIAGAAPEKF